MPRVFYLALSAVTLLFTWVEPTLADKRVALVVGNGAYQNTARLPNPSRDADAVAELFRRANFDVVQTRRDLGNLEFKRALRDFNLAALSADIAVVFFAGHGIEINGVNYLLPIDAKLQRDFDAEDEAVTLDRVVRAVEPAKRLRLVILDACRENPFVRTVTRTAAVRSVVSGLGKVEPTTSDTLIAYAAKAGSVSDDGDDSSNSPFTGALLKHMLEPGLDIRLALGRVRDDVLKTTRNRQEPFVYGSLGGTSVSLVPAPPAPKLDPPVDARADYELVERINTKAAWELFIKNHATGYYVDLARERLKILEEPRPASSASPVSPLPPRAGASTAPSASVGTTPSTEQQGPAAAKVDEEVKGQAEQATPKRMAVLPKLEKPQGPAQFDGAWTITWKGEHCGERSTWLYPIRIENGVIIGKSGSVSASGAARWTQISSYTRGRPVYYTGTFRGNSGSGTFNNPATTCNGTFTARRS